MINLFIIDERVFFGDKGEFQSEVYDALTKLLDFNGVSKSVSRERSKDLSAIEVHQLWVRTNPSDKDELLGSKLSGTLIKNPRLTRSEAISSVGAFSKCSVRWVLNLVNKVDTYRLFSNNVVLVANGDSIVEKIHRYGFCHFNKRLILSSKRLASGLNVHEKLCEHVVAPRLIRFDDLKRATDGRVFSIQDLKKIEEYKRLNQVLNHTPQYFESSCLFVFNSEWRMRRSYTRQMLKQFFDEFFDEKRLLVDDANAMIVENQLKRYLQYGLSFLKECEQRYGREDTALKLALEGLLSADLSSESDRELSEESEYGEAQGLRINNEMHGIDTRSLIHSKKDKR